MEEKQRLNRISQELNKLNSLIEHSKNQTIIAMELLKDCHKLSESSEDEQKNQSHDVSDLFEEADSTSTILIGNNNFFMANQNQSLEISRPLKSKFHHIDQHSKSQLDMRDSNLSSSGFKQSTNEISVIKPVDTTVKKTKLLKSNNVKKKKTIFDKKQRFNSKNDKIQKINRIKSQNKIISNNTSAFKRVVNTMKQQFQTKQMKPNKTGSQFSRNIVNVQRNYLSTKIETLNSKRNGRYNSVSKLQRGQSQKNQKIDKIHKHQKANKNSKSKFHINLEKQVTMKITDLKIKKNLCLVQTSYLSASVKITKQEITKIEDASSKYSDQNLLKYFILKSIIKFISQYNDETWTNSQDIEIDNQAVTNTIKKPEKFIKIINKLPDILRRRNIVSESICRQFIDDKLFIEQKVNNLSNCKGFQKEPLYHYLCQLHLYIEFLLNNNMIHETKRHKIFNPTSEEFFSDRSTKQMKHSNIIKEDNTRNKDYSQRKKKGVTTLKRVSTSKALKKGVTTNKPKKV